MPLAYRKEIDGLRALAIIPVLLFHAGIPGFSGGFVGVDVFFVISGYLIGGQILFALENKSFSFAEFYFRRARRILPVFLFVLIVCSIAAWVLLHPVALVEFSWNAIASVGFSSNIALWMQSGYFDSAAEFKPLLHTWSLSIEEQFYLLAPVTLVLIHRIRKNALFSLVLALTLFSFFAAIWASKKYSSESFYFLPTRAWELFVGVLVAMKASSKTGSYSFTWFEECLGVLGLLLVIGSFLLLSTTVAFPGVATLFPVLGTAMIILYGHNGVVKAILSARLLVFIGLISFSLYLWHQPVLAFSRYWSQDALSINHLVILMGFCFVLAFLSWSFIEKPFRYSKRLSRRTIMDSLVLGSVLVVGFGFLAIKTEGVPARYGAEILKIDAAIADINPLTPYCHVGRGVPSKHPIPGCEKYLSGETFDVLVMGDSHSNAISYALQERLSQAGVSSYAISYSSCIGITGFYPPNAKNIDCHKHNQTLIEYARSVGAESVLITSSFLGYYLNGSNLVFEGRPLDVIERFGDEVDTESARKQRVLKRMELELTKLASDFTVYVVD
ncbi:hypothetical protein A3750_12120, partial [Oleiphilus sp. HI0079]|uniref:acyltransferase family protein n=3 Tax=unclassified Oleiphilus TaxID=2631174 RepID=UPI0007C38A67